MQNGSSVGVCALACSAGSLFRVRWWLGDTMFGLGGASKLLCAVCRSGFYCTLAKLQLCTHKESKARENRKRKKKTKHWFPIGLPEKEKKMTDHFKEFFFPFLFWRLKRLLTLVTLQAHEERDREAGRHKKRRSIKLKLPPLFFEHLFSQKKKISKNNKGILRPIGPLMSPSLFLSSLFLSLLSLSLSLSLSLCIF